MKEILISNIDHGDSLETKIFDIFLEVTIKLRYKPADFIDSTQFRCNLVNNNRKIYIKNCYPVSYQQV